MTFTSMLFGKKTQEVFPLTASHVESLLATAQPAEQAGAPYPCPSAGIMMTEYLHLNAHEARDGVWVCCCGNESTLVHFKGPYPFKYLKCGRCDHIICKNCETTNIIAPIDASDVSVSHSDDGEDLRFFQVCPSCGLTYRTQFRTPDHRGKRLCWIPVASHSHAEMCVCGQAASFDWPKYRILKSYEFRLNPEQAAHDCQMRMLQKKSQNATQLYPQEDSQSPQDRVDPRWEAPGQRHLGTANASGTAKDLRQSQAAHSQSRRERRASLAVVTNWSSLKRSGAQRGRQHSYTPRSYTFQDSPVTPRPTLHTRAETWATANEHHRAHEAAEKAVKSFMNGR